MDLTVTVKSKLDVRYLRAKMGVRYWEDAEVNGQPEPDEDSGELPKIPFGGGEYWHITIDLEDGRIEGWPSGTTAKTHYKVCDDGQYELLDVDRKVVRSIDGYVPSMMCPDDNGYGDYVIMTIDGDGRIANWTADLSAFEDDSED